MVSLAKSYEFAVNQYIDPQDPVGKTGIQQCSDLFWHIKNTLISYAHSPWTVVASSGYVGGSWTYSAGDNWPDYTAVLWNSGTNPHAWIVLERVDGGQLLIDCNATSTRTDYITARWSNEGLFTGGSTTVAATAVDSQDMINIQVWKSSAYTLQYFVLHMIHSEDGEIDHILMTRAGVPFQYWGFQTVQCPVANYTLNNIAFGLYNDTSTNSRCGYGNHVDNSYWIAKKEATGDGTGLFRCCLTTLMGGSLQSCLGITLESLNWMSEQHTLYPIGVFSLTAGYEGRHGHLADQWFVPSSLQTGFCIEDDPDNPTREIAVFANMAFPWDGSDPVVS